MKAENQHKRNITAWVSDVQKEIWNERRLKESVQPDHPIGWSEWIAQKVNLTLNATSLQEDAQTDTVETAHLQRQLTKLQDRIKELESREVGVSDTRILRILSGDYTDFTNIVQALVDTEAEAAYETVQRLAADGEVECDKDGRRWRLKHESL